MTDGGLEHLKPLNALHSLRLAHTRVTDAGVDKLRELTTLDFLDLDNTKVTAGGENKLHRHCQIASSCVRARIAWGGSAGRREMALRTGHLSWPYSSPLWRNRVEYGHGRPTLAILCRQRAVAERNAMVFIGG